MYAASFGYASAHKYETTGNVEGNDVILTEACGCPLHVLGPKVGAGTTHKHARTRAHTHTHSVSYSKIPSSNFPRNQINSQILFIYLFFLIPPKANSGTAPQISGPGSVVGIRAGRSGDRIPVEARFSAPVQTAPGAHPASCTMGTGFFPGLMSGRGVTLTPHPLLVLWSRKSRVIPLLPPVGRTACTEPQCLYKGALYLLLPQISHDHFISNDFQI